MSILLDLAAILRLDSKKYEDGIKDAKDKAGKFGDAMKTAGKVAATAFAAVTTATAAVTTALVKATGEAAAYGDNIDKMSQKLGISAEAYQEWDAVLQHSGTDISAMTGAMRTLTKQASSSSDAFEKLGISQQEVANLSQEDLFAKVVAGLQSMEEGTERSALATELLGRGAIEMGALLNTSAEDTAAMRKRVHELNGVMSNEAVKAAAAYQDSLQDMTTALDGLKRNVVSDFMPSITTVMNGLTEIFAGDTEGGVGMITEGIGSMVDGISEKIPEILEVGAGIITALVGAIGQNLPTLIQAGAQTVISIVTGIVKQLPSILKASLEVIKTMASGLSKSFSEMIPTLVEVMLEITEVLIDNVGVLVDAAIEIIVTLAQGVIDALPKLLEKMSEIIQAVLKALTDNMPKLIQAGVDIIVMLINGITDNLPTLIAMAPVIIQDVLSALIQNLPLLITAGIQAIPQIVTGLIRAIPELLKAVPQLIGALLSSLIEGAKSLLSAGREMVTKVWEGFKQKIEDAKQWGRDLIQNFKDGITQKWENLKSKIRDIGQGIKNFLGFSEPKEGPLSDFHTYAPDMMQLFAKGIRDNEDVVYNQLRKSFDFEDQLSSGFNLSTTGSSDYRGSDSENLPPIRIVVQSVLDKRIIGETSYDYIKGRTRAGEFGWV